MKILTLILTAYFAFGLNVRAEEAIKSQYDDLKQAEYISIIDTSFDYFIKNSPWNHYELFHFSISGSSTFRVGLSRTILAHGRAEDGGFL